MPPRKKPEQKFIRNIRAVPIGVRLGTGRRIDLRPRGERGDTAPLKPEEEYDEIFLGNVGLLFEVISADEGKTVIAKQTTNQQSVHPALASMRNEYGQEYTKGVVMVEESAEERPVIASVDERGMITRFKAPGTTDKPLPAVPSHVPPEEQADWIARNAKTEGPEAGLAGRQVIKGNVEQI